MLPGVPEAAPWTVLRSDGERDDVLCRAAPTSSSIATETTYYRDNLATGAPSLWVVLRRPDGDPPYQLVAVTADPAEGEGFDRERGQSGRAGADAASRSSELVAAFVAEHHVERQFFKRKRDRADPEALARRALWRSRRMSDEEDFLTRWSRRKREARSAKPPQPEAGDAGDACRSSRCRRPRARTKPQAAFDPASLPPIESITALSDITAFLRAGVPAELTRAALRRAWTADPAIRDFVGLAENAWDFTDPNAMPGFGPLESTDDVRRMIARIVDSIGEAAQPADAEALGRTRASSRKFERFQRGRRAAAANRRRRAGRSAPDQDGERCCRNLGQSKYCCKATKKMLQRSTTLTEAAARSQNNRRGARMAARCRDN